MEQHLGKSESTSVYHCKKKKTKKKRYIKENCSNTKVVIKAKLI